jgi:hypothetical protein
MALSFLRQRLAAVFIERYQLGKLMRRAVGAETRQSQTAGGPRQPEAT